MSRGLGKRQRLLLATLAAAEARHGQGWFYVAGVLNRAWAMGLDAEAAERKAAEDAAYEAQKAARRAWLADLETKAQAGDEDAKKTLKDEQDRDTMLSFLARSQQSCYEPPLRTSVQQDLENAILTRVPEALKTARNARNGQFCRPTTRRPQARLAPSWPRILTVMGSSTGNGLPAIDQALPRVSNGG